MSPADLHRAVAATLTSKRLGQPVFVRYLFHDPATKDRAVERLAQVAGVVREWLGQPLDRLYALGGGERGHATVTLECRGGATAVITWIGTNPRGPGIDLTVIGNRGALYHDVGDSNAWEDAAWQNQPAAEPGLVAWIERALRSGRPEAEPAP